MNAKLRNSLISGAIATLLSSPALAGDMAPGQPPVEDGRAALLLAQATQTTPASPGQSGTAASITNPLYSLTPQQLRRMEVVDVTGEEVGKVKSVVRNRDGQDIMVLVSSGGFLGMGAKEIAVSLDDVRLGEDKLHLSSTKQELEARGETPRQQYVELEPKDQPISEFSAFEPMTEEPGQMRSAPATPSAPMERTPTEEGSPLSPTE